MEVNYCSILALENRSVILNYFVKKWCKLPFYYYVTSDTILPLPFQRVFVISKNIHPKYNICK